MSNGLDAKHCLGGSVTQLSSFKDLAPSKAYSAISYVFLDGSCSIVCMSTEKTPTMDGVRAELSWDRQGQQLIYLMAFIRAYK